MTIPETAPRPPLRRKKPDWAESRQAKYQAKLRAMSLLERLLRRPAGDIYTSQEQMHLAEFRLAAESLTQAAERLNALVTARLKVRAVDPASSAEAREEAILCLAELRRKAAVYHPPF